MLTLRKLKESLASLTEEQLDKNLYCFSRYWRTEESDLLFQIDEENNPYLYVVTQQETQFAEECVALANLIKHYATEATPFNSRQFSRVLFDPYKSQFIVFAKTGSPLASKKGSGTVEVKENEIIGYLENFSRISHHNLHPINKVAEYFRDNPELVLSNGLSLSIGEGFWTFSMVEDGE